MIGRPPVQRQRILDQRADAVAVAVEIGVEVVVVVIIGVPFCLVGFARGGAQREATAAGEAAGCAAERVTYWAAGAMVRGWAWTAWGRAPVCAAFRRVPTPRAAI